MKPQRLGGGRALEVVVCLEETVVEVVHLRTSGQVRAGTAPGCRIALPPELLAGAEQVTLATLDDTGQAFVARGLEPGTRPLGDSENASIELGQVRVFVRFTVDNAVAVGGAFLPDRELVQAVVGSAAACLAFVWILTLIPPEARALSLDLADRERGLTVAKIKPNEDPKKELTRGEGDAGDSATSDAPAATAASPGAVGKMGRDDAKNPAGQTAIKGDKAENRPGPGDAHAWVRDKGALGVMRTIDWAPVVGGQEEWGKDREYAYGGDANAAAGDGPGTWGGGYEGYGPGGCPPGAVHCIPGSIGVGNRMNTGVSAWDGPGGPGQHVKLGPKRDHGPKVSFEPPTVMDDGLDRAIVKRYVQSKKDAYAYCYDRQLQIKNDLGGTVALEFVISPNGNVISVVIADNSVDQAVGSCVKEAVATIQFPRSAQMTKVKYPFIFRQAGSK
jgi:TonB family protein